MPRCGSCGREAQGEFAFCPHCGAAQGAPVSESRKIVTVVFCDLVGSTALGEGLDPESLSRLLSKYFERMRGVIERHGGTVEKFIGDAIVGAFGVPVAHEDDALRAVRAAVDMRAALAELNDEVGESWNLSLTARTGVNTGEVLISGRGPGEALAVGDPMNVAARLQQAAEPGEIVVSGSTRRLVADAAVVEALGSLELKGRAQPVDAFRLVELDQPTGLARRLDSPMVGRDGELATLRAAFERVAEETSPELVTVAGDAGVGKSRLLAEFISGIGERATVLRGRCLPYGEGITYWPLLQIIRQAAGIAETDDRETSRAKVFGLVEQSPQSQMIARRISTAVGFEDGTASPEEITWAARRLFETLASKRPLVVVVDDIHWAESAFVTLLSESTGTAGAAPYLVVCASRPDLFDRHPEWEASRPGASTIALEPLGSDEAERLLTHLLGGVETPDQVRDVVLRASEGNPLFVEQLVSMLIDEGKLVERDGAWMPSGDLSALQIPPSIHALLAARIDALTGDERAAIERAAVVGAVFYQEAVEAMAPDGASSIGGALESLTRRNLIGSTTSDLEGLTAYRFRHILIREAVYVATLKSLRATLHHRFAEWMESVGAVASTEFEEILGYHLEQAYALSADLGPVNEEVARAGARGAEMLASAGRRAMLRSDLQAAIGLLGRAERLLPRDSEERVEVLIDLGRADPSPDLSAGIPRLAEAADLARRLGLRRQELHASMQLAYELAWNSGSLRAVVDSVQPFIEPLEELGDLAGLSYAWRQIARGLSGMGRVGEALEFRARSLELARRANDPWEERETLRIGWMVIFGPTPASEAQAELEDLIAYAVEHDAPILEVAAQFGVGYFLACRGQFDAARPHAERARALATEFGWEHLAAIWGGFHGWIEFLAGGLDRAEPIMRMDMETLTRLTLAKNVTSYAADFAWMLCEEDRFDDARSFCELAEATDEEDTTTITVARSVRARIEAGRGAHARAERLARQAVALGETTDDVDRQAMARMALASVLHMGGKVDEAISALHRAVALYEHRGNRIMAARAAERLALMGAGSSLGADG